jgi:hypothetical protein
MRPYAYIALLTLTLARLAGAQAQGRNPPPPVPHVVHDICPGEGCEYGTWIACGQLAVHVAEDTTSPVAFTLMMGTRFHALTGNLRVIQAGLVAFRDTVRITDYESLGNDTLVFTPADSLYPLFYGSEGTGTWYLHGKEDGGPWFFPDEHNGWAQTPGVALVRSPLVKWWVHIVIPSGRFGWLDATDAKIAGSAPHYEETPPRCPERG